MHDYFTANAPDQLLEIQLEDDDDDKIRAIRNFLHCGRNFSMVHGNHNEAKGRTMWEDRHTLDLDIHQMRAKYSRFQVEMGYKHNDHPHPLFGKPENISEPQNGGVKETRSTRNESLHEPPKITINTMKGGVSNGTVNDALNGTVEGISNEAMSEILNETLHETRYDALNGTLKDVFNITLNGTDVNAH